MLTEVRTAMHEKSENFNRERETIKKYRRHRLKNTVTELKNSVKGFKNRLGQLKEKILRPKDAAVELLPSEGQRELDRVKTDSFRASASGPIFPPCK